MSTDEDFEAGGEPAVTLAFSAEQFAAVLEADSLVPGGTVGNRLVGGLRLLGCAAEVDVLAAAPDPTLLTKVASVGLAGHSADQCSTGARQV